MLGLRDVEYRIATVRMPNSPLLLEFMELKGAPGTATRSRVQDPGSFRLQLNVRDIDAALAGITAAGSTVVSTNRAPVSMTFGSRPWRLAVVPDPNNLFLVVQQPPPAASAPQPDSAPAPRLRRPPPARRRTRRWSANTAFRVTTRARARPIWRSTRWTSATSPRRRRVGEGDQESPVGRDAAARHAAARRRGARALVSFLETALDRAAAARPNPGVRRCTG